MIIATIEYHWTVVSNTFNSNGNVYINEPEWWGIGWNDLKSVAIGRLASSLLHISIGAEWTQVSLLTARSGVLFFFLFYNLSQREGNDVVRMKLSPRYCSEATNCCTKNHVRCQSDLHTDTDATRLFNDEEKKLGAL